VKPFNVPTTHCRENTPNKRDIRTAF